MDPDPPHLALGAHVVRHLGPVVPEHLQPLQQQQGLLLGPGALGADRAAGVWGAHRSRYGHQATRQVAATGAKHAPRDAGETKPRKASAACAGPLPTATSGAAAHVCRRSPQHPGLREEGPPPRPPRPPSPPPCPPSGVTWRLCAQSPWLWCRAGSAPPRRPRGTGRCLGTWRSDSCRQAGARSGLQADHRAGEGGRPSHSRMRTAS